MVGPILMREIVPTTRNEEDEVEKKKGDYLDQKSDLHPCCGSPRKQL
jgi:hypothetical protein